MPYASMIATRTRVRKKRLFSIVEYAPTAGYAPAGLRGRHNPMSGLSLNLKSNEHIFVERDVRLRSHRGEECECMFSRARSNLTYMDLPLTGTATTFLLKGGNGST